MIGIFIIAVLRIGWKRLYPTTGIWASVVRFYAAVHLMNAHLVSKPSLFFDPDTAIQHSDRKKAMDKCGDLPKSARDRYRELKDISESIRYVVGFTFLPAHREKVNENLEWLDRLIAPWVKRNLV